MAKDISITDTQLSGQKPVDTTPVNPVQTPQQVKEQINSQADLPAQSQTPNHPKA